MTGHTNSQTVFNVTLSPLVTLPDITLSTYIKNHNYPYKIKQMQIDQVCDGRCFGLIKNVHRVEDGSTEMKAFGYTYSSLLPYIKTAVENLGLSDGEYLIIIADGMGFNRSVMPSVTISNGVMSTTWSYTGRFYASLVKSSTAHATINVEFVYKKS